MLTFITGGIKSGKSLFAEKLAQEEQLDVYYVATATITDEEMQKRVDEHIRRRPASWWTIEENKDLNNIFHKLTSNEAVIMIDCLTTYLTNRLWHEHPEVFQTDLDLPDKNIILNELKALAEKFKLSHHKFILVSNEVGLSLIPPTKIGRIFCDLQGKANQIFAEKADSVYLTVSGIPIKIK